MKLRFFFIIAWKLCIECQKSVRVTEKKIHYITKTCLFKYTDFFTTKNEYFQMKNSDIFHISAQNIDFGYSLEPPRQGGSNEYPQSMFLSRDQKK